MIHEAEYSNEHLRHPVVSGGEIESSRFRDRGNISLKKGDYGAAEQLYGMALGSAGNVAQYVMGFSNRAEARLRMGRYEAAAADASRAVQLDPQNVKAFYRLGQAHRHLNDNMEALKAFGKALALRPTEPEILEAMRTCSEPVKNPPQQPEIEQKHEEITESDDEVIDISDSSLITSNAPNNSEKKTVTIQEPVSDNDDDDDEVLDIPFDSVITQQPTATSTAPLTSISISEKFQSSDLQLVNSLKSKLSLCEEDEPDVIPITSENENLITEEYQQPSQQVIEANRERAIKVMKGVKNDNNKTKSLNEMYRHFQSINDDQSDDEDDGKTMLREAAEQVNPELVSQAKTIFDAFDKDKNGFWSYEEAILAAQTLENRELTPEAFNIRCEEYGSDRTMGWASSDLINMYTSSPENVIGLRKHLEIVNQQERREKGVDIHTYSPEEHVEAFINNLWKKGTVYGQGSKNDTYDIIWHDGEGTRDVPASCLRKLFVGWAGDEKGVPAKKKIAAGQHLDPNTGLLAPVTRTDESSSSSRERPSAEEMDKWGSNLVSELPAKSDLPEEPVQRLGMTVAMTGMGDEGGMLSKEKVRGFLNLRKRAG